MIQNAWVDDLPEIEEDLFKVSSFPILNSEEGIKTTGSKSILIEMLYFLLNSLPQDIQLIKAAHEAQDWEKAQQLAHKIKGGVVYVGAVRIKMACQYFENGLSHTDGH